ncbi:MAG: gfo/Idh/MocA family oxidoreductase, partial [Planctomycetes bacterium]|nr:gfo/Idh/MocA family oxidoreductase [Planctomycetota bacterium]
MTNRRFTRRRLLKSAAVAAAGTPYLITSAALGNAETPPASERVVLGHIGVGNRGRSLLRGFMNCKDAVSVAA